mmetsp:Transcript_17396/g.46963  ORF Transcript_17396/g.46963 Transcript_17396/m.46963 type:complete len:385 (+) Transcript_17396:89-1243(+)
MRVAGSRDRRRAPTATRCACLPTREARAGGFVSAPCSGREAHDACGLVNSPRVLRTDGRCGWELGIRAHDHNGVLCVHAVLCLLEDFGRWALHHLVRHLAPTLRRQTVEEDGVLLASRLHELRRDTKALKALEALLERVLLSHGRPHIRVNDICPRHSCCDVTRHSRLARARLVHLGHPLLAGAKTFRAGAHKVDVGNHGELEPGLDDVVPVAHVDDALARDVTEHLLDGEGVGDDLAGVVEVGKAIDHGNLGVLGKLQEVCVAEEAGHDDVVVARQHAAHVLDSLARAQADLIPKAERVAAEESHARLERHASATRGLCKYHGHRAAVKGAIGRGARLDKGLDLLGKIKDVAQLERCEVIYVEEVALLVAQHGCAHARPRRAL